jgi:hypothetical protein
MVEVAPDLMIQISLTTPDDSQEEVMIAFSSEKCAEMRLSTAQARILASELIQIVHRAEVKNSLRKAALQKRESVADTDSRKTRKGNTAWVPANQ